MRFDDWVLLLILVGTPLVIALYLVKFPVQTLAVVGFVTLLCLIGEVN